MLTGSQALGRPATPHGEPVEAGRIFRSGAGGTPRCVSLQEVMGAGDNSVVKFREEHKNYG